MSVAAVLLAAGGGTRFQGHAHKLLADLAGRPLVAHALGNMTAAPFAAYAIVTGAADLSGIVPPGVEVIPNANWERGQATSLGAAVGWASAGGFDAIVIGLGDQPGVRPACWAAVAGADTTAIAVATYAGARGHPVRLAREVWARLPTTGDRGARVVMAESPELVAEVACDGDPDDVDTAEDLVRLADRARVAELLGREPRGAFEVVRRGPDGAPTVIRNAPLLPDGSPMPTLYWLIGPEEVAAVSRLEAAGGVRQAAAAVDPAAIADAHRRYALERDVRIPADWAGPRPSGGVGGTRVGVKCLHAHYAWYLAGGDDPVGRWVADQLAGQR